MLLLLKVAFAIASAEANNGTCCYHKIFPDGSYTLKESNSAEAAAYGCDTANSCVYVKDGTNDRYCMKMGGMSVPDCEPRRCEEYLITLVNADSYNVFAADGFATDCQPPTFEWPTSYASYMANVDGDIVGLWRNNNERKHYMEKLQANGPAVNLNATFPKDFPESHTLITNWGPNKLLAVGGWDGTKDIDKVFKYENGAWTDIGWTLDSAQHGGIACTYNDKLVLVGGWKMGSRNSKNPVQEMVVHDLSNSGAVLKTVDLTGATWITCVCQKDKVYLVINQKDGEQEGPKDELYTYDLTNGGDELGTKMKFPNVKGGQLGFFRDKLTLFGALDANGNAVKTMQVYDDSKDLWEEKPFERKITDSFDYFVVVEK